MMRTLQASLESPLGNKKTAHLKEFAIFFQLDDASVPFPTERKEMKSTERNEMKSTERNRTKEKSLFRSVRLKFDLYRNNKNFNCIKNRPLRRKKYEQVKKLKIELIADVLFVDIEMRHYQLCGKRQLVTKKI
uniref:Uncharacterized protein n=1 Tax=Romanomermis culicivorax TaxID=13658 RepID=A0A915JI71_ROMCU